MRALRNKTNVLPPDSDYTFGRVKDDDGSRNGTPVNEELLGDVMQFFEKLMFDAGISMNNLPENAYSGFQLNQALTALIDSMNGGLRKTVVEIGNWNLATTGNIDVTIPVNYKKVRSVEVIIRDDSDVYYTKLTASYSGAPLAPAAGGYEFISGINSLTLYKTSIGALTYTNVSSFNRGWIVLGYVL